MNPCLTCNTVAQPPPVVYAPSAPTYVEQAPGPAPDPGLKDLRPAAPSRGWAPSLLYRPSAVSRTTAEEVEMRAPLLGAVAVAIREHQRAIRAAEN